MFLPDPPHGWNDTHAAWNLGRNDQLVPNKVVQTMTYHTRRDLQYQYALADAFTICDNYYYSLMGPTDPNRYHMWTGWVGNDGGGGGPVITNAKAGYDWSTYPERLERAGISWKIYQDIGVGLDAAGFWGWTAAPYIGNFGDNSLRYFHQYQFAMPGTPLADRAKTGTNINALNRDLTRLMDVFREDVQRGRLPQVSWIAAPEAYCEHPNWEPDFGTWYVAGRRPGLESRRLEQDGPLHHVRRGRRLLRSPDSPDAAADACAGSLDRRDHQRNLPRRSNPFECTVRVRHPRADVCRLAVEPGRLHVRSGHAEDAPRTYTVEPHRRVADSWRPAAIGASDFDLSIYGPNGFFRSFKGGVSGSHRADLDIRAIYDEDRSHITLQILNRASRIARVRIANVYTSRGTSLVLGSGKSDSKNWSLARSWGLVRPRDHG